MSVYSGSISIVYNNDLFYTITHIPFLVVSHRITNFSEQTHLYYLLYFSFFLYCMYVLTFTLFLFFKNYYFLWYLLRHRDFSLAFPFFFPCSPCPHFPSYCHSTISCAFQILWIYYYLSLVLIFLTGNGWPELLLISFYMRGKPHRDYM